ncbi:MAG: CPBP family intramembrane metalloprotease [Clostridiales bacterium]|nr:CPBP family intramembrane metalloprotease [Clostridiales bacterium]
MKNKKTTFVVITIASCILSVLFSAVDICYSQKERVENLLDKIVPLFFVMPLLVLFLSTTQKKIFNKIKNLWYLVPCLLVAINNLPFIPWIKGLNKFANVGFQEVLLFIFYCVLIGVFEEIVFRGIIFPSLLSRFEKSKKGLIKSMIISSVIFGVAHIVNAFSGAGIIETLLQVVYSSLIGGLCAFAFVKTNNIVSSIVVHALYNFCGLLFNAKIGLGLGVSFDLPTVIITAVLAVLVFVFVVLSLFFQSKKEVDSFYKLTNC